MFAGMLSRVSDAAAQLLVTGYRSALVHPGANRDGLHASAIASAERCRGVGPPVPRTGEVDQVNDRWGDQTASVPEQRLWAMPRMVRCRTTHDARCAGKNKKPHDVGPFMTPFENA